MLAKELIESSSQSSVNEAEDTKIKLVNGTITAKELIELDYLDLFSISKDIKDFIGKNSTIEVSVLSPEDEKVLSYPRDNKAEVKQIVDRGITDKKIYIYTKDISKLYLKYLAYINNKWEDITKEIALVKNDVTNRYEYIFECPEYLGYFNILTAKAEPYAKCPTIPNRLIINNGIVLVNKLSEINDKTDKIIIKEKEIVTPKATSRRRRN